MLVNLKNDSLEVTINSVGAEVKSVVREGVEYMHQVDDAWNRTSPNLFPFVGCLTGKKYDYKGVDYPNLRHGFLRDAEFEVIEQTETTASFRIKADAELLKVYPFDFELVIKHSIEANVLQTSFHVVNNGDEDMYFGLGTHAGFYTNHDGTNLNDWYVLFDSEEDDYQVVTKDGLQTGEKGTHLVGKKFELNTNLFEVDSQLFHNIKSDHVRLMSDKTTKSVDVWFEGMPYLCIWSPAHCDTFNCIEPWVTTVGKENGPTDISKREDMRHLNPKEEFDVAYEMGFNK